MTEQLEGLAGEENQTAVLNVQDLQEVSRDVQAVLCCFIVKQRMQKYYFHKNKVLLTSL